MALRMRFAIQDLDVMELHPRLPCADACSQPACRVVARCALTPIVSARLRALRYGAAVFAPSLRSERRLEARGVEKRSLFAPCGEPAHLFVFPHIRFSAEHTKMHCHEAFVSRPVPSRGGPGGVRCVGPPAAGRTHSLARNFLAKDS